MLPPPPLVLRQRHVEGDRGPDPIRDIRDELRTRPYDIVSVAGIYQHRTRPAYAAVIRGAGAVGSPRITLSPLEQLALTVIAYFQPVARMQIGDVLGKAVSGDLIAALRSAGLVATDPRSPQPGAPYTYVTTNGFLQLSGLESLRDVLDFDRLEEAGLLGKAPLPHELQSALGLANEAEAETEDREEADGTWPHSRNKLQTIDCPAALQ